MELQRVDRTARWIGINPNHAPDLQIALLNRVLLLEDTHEAVDLVRLRSLQIFLCQFFDRHRAFDLDSFIAVTGPRAAIVLLDSQFSTDPEIVVIVHLQRRDLALKNWLVRKGHSLTGFGIAIEFRIGSPELHDYLIDARLIN